MKSGRSTYCFENSLTQSEREEAVDEQQVKRIKRGGRKNTLVPKQTMHLYLLPDIVAKMHIIAQHDEKLIGDLVADWADRRWQQIKRSRKRIRPNNHTIKAIHRWIKSDVDYDDELAIIELVCQYSKPSPTSRNDRSISGWKSACLNNTIRACILLSSPVLKPVYSYT